MSKERRANSPGSRGAVPAGGESIGATEGGEGGVSGRAWVGKQEVSVLGR